MVAIDSQLFAQGLAGYAQYDDKTWGLVDCISFVVMQENLITEALTFDGDFVQAGFTVVRG